MVPPANTSGALLLVLMKYSPPHSTHVPVSLEAPLETVFLHFCESGITNNFIPGLFYSNGDPLWDGQGCGPTNTCCAFNSPPWFNVTLSSSTTDDIKIRICGNLGINNEDSLIQLIKLYVK